MRCRWVVPLLLMVSLLAEVGTSQEPPLSTNSRHKEQKHIDSKRDIESIGKRNLGSRGLGNWYSFEREIEIGHEYSAEIETTVTLLQDPVICEYVNRVGQTLVHNSDAKLPFTIKVVNSDEINAFSLPGGFLYINVGVILDAESESELAAVMAHEIAHVAAHHAMREMTRSQLFNLASMGLMIVGGPAGSAIQQVTSIAFPMGMMKFSRGFEAEADYLGLQYLYASGYDPQAFISLLERISAQDKKKHHRWAGLFAMHPVTSDRIKKATAEMSEILPDREVYLLNTSEFDMVKRRALDLQDAIQGGEASGGPTLRRRTKSSKTDGPMADSQIPASHPDTPPPR
jgi:predicted Zn-dependent protease